MPALNYQAQFAPPVETGEKTQTIRATRQRPIKVGDALYHYTGMRTKKCRRLIPEPTPCIYAEEIIIRSGYVYLDDNLLSFEEMIDLAIKDGFKAAPIELSIGNFMSFFLEPDKPEFIGQLIKWEFPK